MVRYCFFFADRLPGTRTLILHTQKNFACVGLKVKPVLKVFAARIRGRNKLITPFIGLQKHSDALLALCFR